ncbi:MAG: methionyl-tRNA formyltransferase [Flavobacteriales bacterium]|nr:methionyl-tRNA formyltransferase [Flavobacteriales bacterium]
MKDKKDLRIVFMGTPEFAVAQLDELLAEKYNVVSVVTVPDRPAGRGKKLTASAVKEYAVAHDLPVLQPEKMRDEAFLEQLKELKADLFVVVAFRMLPKIVWQMSPMGTFNLHGSLLPDYRGAAPINWAIINGEKKTGLTTFLLDEKIDTGSIILQREMEILPEDNFGIMYHKLMEMGRRMTVDTIEMIRTDAVKAIPQHEPNIEKPAPKIFKDTTLIRWTKNAEDVVNLVRGLAPVPGAYALMWHAGSDTPLKIYSAEVTSIPSDGNWGHIKTEGKRLFVAAADFYVELKEVKAEGKKQMSIVDFLNGFRMCGDEKFL